MSKCKNCNVEILDVTEHCPLCHSVLIQTEDLEDMYPDVRMMIKRMMVLSRIYLFCMLLVDVILVWINIQTGIMVWWSLIAGIILFYGYLFLRYTVLGKTSYRKKVTVSVFIGVISLLAMDYLTGNHGWALNYAIPTVILIMNIYILYVMIDRKRTWQSYIVWQMGIVCCSFGPAILYWTGKVTTKYALIPLLASCATLAGTFIIGGNRAKMELKRRFHI